MISKISKKQLNDDIVEQLNKIEDLTNENRILRFGEPHIEIDEKNYLLLIKVGDGVTPLNNLKIYQVSALEMGEI